MNELLKDGVLIVVGAVLGFLSNLLFAYANEKRSRFRVYRLAFKGFPDFHKRMFFENLSNEVWDNKIPSHLHDHCMTFVFFLESVGGAVVKDVRITVHARNGSGIVAHHFLVAKTAICGRLDLKSRDDKELVATWKYINPGDDIELHVLVTGIDNQNDVEIGVDAEGAKVAERFLLDKTIRVSACVGEMPIGMGKRNH